MSHYYFTLPFFLIRFSIKYYNLTYTKLNLYSDLLNNRIFLGML